MHIIKYQKLRLEAGNITNNLAVSKKKEIFENSVVYKCPRNITLIYFLKPKYKIDFSA